jgi:hypothetical protein
VSLLLAEGERSVMLLLGDAVQYDPGELRLGSVQLWNESKVLGVLMWLSGFVKL